MVDGLSQLSVSFWDEIVEVLLIHGNDEEDNKGDKEPDVSYAEEAPAMVPFLLRVDQFRKLRGRERGEQEVESNKLPFLDPIVTALALTDTLHSVNNL